MKGQYDFDNDDELGQILFLMALGLFIIVVIVAFWVGEGRVSAIGLEPSESCTLPFDVENEIDITTLMLEAYDEYTTHQSYTDRWYALMENDILPILGGGHWYFGMLDLEGSWAMLTVTRNNQYTLAIGDDWQLQANGQTKRPRCYMVLGIEYAQQLAQYVITADFEWFFTVYAQQYYTAPDF